MVQAFRFCMGHDMSFPPKDRCLLVLHPNATTIPGRFRSKSAVSGCVRGCAGTGKSARNGFDEGYAGTSDWAGPCDGSGAGENTDISRLWSFMRQFVCCLAHTPQFELLWHMLTFQMNVLYVFNANTSCIISRSWRSKLVQGPGNTRRALCDMIIEV